METAIVVALISAGGSITAAVIGLMNNRLGHKNTKAIKNAMDSIEDLEKNTNSIKDALVEVTGKSEHARGKLEGAAEALAVNRTSESDI